MLRNSTFGVLVRSCAQRRYSIGDPESNACLNTQLRSPQHHGLPEETEKSLRIVTWNGPDDPESPLNFSLSLKIFITVLICFYTWAVYVGSSLYTSSQDIVAAKFGVNHVGASLGLALYVLAYGLGSLLFSPLSEVPAIGRNPPYAVSGLLFVVLCIPTSLVDNFPGLVVLRFLLGFMGSPCLATAGASLNDIWGPDLFCYAMALWAATTSMGPTLGPVISSFAVKVGGWRWSSWELLIVSGTIYALFFCLMPETSAPTILHYRAKLLRQSTGDMSFRSEDDIKRLDTDLTSRLWFSLTKPWEINFKDPALFFTTFYFGLLYGILYSFFEETVTDGMHSLPLVYPPMYQFSATSTSLIWLCTLPALAVAFPVHCVYLYRKVLPKLQNGTFGEPEGFLLPGVLAGAIMPAALFMFAWTSSPSIHWIVPTIALGLVMFSMYFLTQSIFLYIPQSYPKFAASIFAANSCFRSIFASGCILFARPMFGGMGVGGGVSLLAGLTVVCGVLISGLWWSWGKKLRARSSFAE